MTSKAERETAQDAINEVMANAQGPYFDPNDPRHGRAVEEMQKLFTIVSGPERRIEAGNHAQDQINAIFADTAHPYHHGGHPEHRAAVAEMQGYYQAAHPNEPPEPA